MKILCLHSDYIRWKAKEKAIKRKFEEFGEKEGEEEECLVCFTCVEEGDKEKIDKAIAEIEQVCNWIKCKKIVLYPYAHLFPEKLAKISEAIEVLKELEKKLKEKGYEVKSACFGYYKEFEIKVKGHPLAELSRKV